MGLKARRKLDFGEPHLGLKNLLQLVPDIVFRVQGENVSAFICG